MFPKKDELFSKEIIPHLEEILSLTLVPFGDILVVPADDWAWPPHLWTIKWHHQNTRLVEPHNRSHYLFTSMRSSTFDSTGNKYQCREWPNIKLFSLVTLKTIFLLILSWNNQPAACEAPKTSPCWHHQFLQTWSIMTAHEMIDNDKSFTFSQIQMMEKLY